MKKKIVVLLSLLFLFLSCAVNRTYISDYGEKMRITKEYFPEIYDLYRQGDVRIGKVYLDQKDGVGTYRILYYYRDNN